VPAAPSPAARRRRGAGRGDHRGIRPTTRVIDEFGILRGRRKLLGQQSHRSVESNQAARGPRSAQTIETGLLAVIKTATDCLEERTFLHPTARESV
jgi:hypothetical protein